MKLRLWIAVSLGVPLALAQQAPPAPEPAAAPAGAYTLPPGTKVPLSLINTISTKHTEQGDRVYLETAFPVLSGGRIVVPVGSYVAGTVTKVKKPGRIKGRGELYVRFDSLTLPNGITRDFRARVGGVDGQASGQLGEAEGAGASVGAIASRTALGSGIGAAAGAAAGLVGVLLTRGPDAVLPRGSTVEMILDRPIEFQESELNFTNAPPPHSAIPAAPAAPTAAKNVLGTGKRP